VARAARWRVPYAPALPARGDRGSSPLDYEAQLATLVERPPEGDAWLHEQKFDGYRIGLRKDGGVVSLWSRRHNDWTAEFRSVTAAGSGLLARSALLDGEVAMLAPSGLTDFQSLQNRRSGTPLVYFAFDLLTLDGVDLRQLPIEERKARLRQLVGAGAPDVIRLSDHVEGQGAAFFAAASELGLEGMVSKKLGSPYRAGRNGDWLKTKCVRRRDFVVGGFTEPERSRSGLGALLLGYYEAGELRWAGKAGTGQGWTVAFLRDLRARLDALAVAGTPFSPPVADPAIRRSARWVRPQLVVEVTYTEWTDAGYIRHPSVQRLRIDVHPLEVLGGPQTGGVGE